ncbi:PqqD family protein [Streptococcus vestibularis]|mgnify:CR=1 FL=1|uniref:PqqD family protein n=1 Tax=Streptococcus vestibularis TaxID=1343 RepID=UPI0039C13D03
MFNKESKTRLKIIKQDNGAIVFDKDQGIYFQTNEVGVKILELLSKNKNEEDIVSTISDAYSIETDVAKQDVKDFIQSLKKEGYRLWICNSIKSHTPMFS